MLESPPGFARVRGRAVKAIRDAGLHFNEVLDRAQQSVLTEQGFPETQSLIVSARVSYSGLLRLSGRTLTAVYGVGRMRRGRARRAATILLAVSVASDVIELVGLHRNERVLGRQRAVRDVLETGLYAAALENYTFVAVSGCPLVTEAAFRYGPNAALLLAPHFAAAIAGRRIARRDLSLDCLYYLVVGLIGGLEVRQAEDRRVSEHRRRREAEWPAVQASAENTGRLSVLFHPLDSPDALEESAHEIIANSRVVLDMSDVEPGSPLGQIVDNRRESLWAGPAAFLGEALSRWAVEYRRSVLRLADQVWQIHYLGETEHILISERQEAALRVALERFAPRGALTVWAAPGLASAIELRVSTATDHARIRLPPADDQKFASGDPISASSKLGAFWALGHATRAGHSVPISVAVPGAAAFYGAAWYTEVQVARRGSSAHASAIRAALAAATVQLLSDRWNTGRSAAKSTGAPRLPVKNALVTPAIVTGYAWKSLTRNERIEILVEELVFIAGGALLLERPRPLRHLAINLALGPALGALAGSAYRDHAERDTERESDAFRTAMTELADDTAHAAKLAEWRLVHRAAADAITRVREGLDDEVRERYTRALAYVVDLASSQLHREVDIDLTGKADVIGAFRG